MPDHNHREMLAASRAITKTINMIEVAWAQALPYGFTVTPGLRYYTQSAADFYFNPPWPKGYGGEGSLYTADTRLAAFGAITAGVIVGKTLWDGWNVSLRADFYRAHMSPRVTARWDGIATSAGTRRGAPGHGVDMADHVMAARQRVNLAVSAVGPELGGVLIDVCCHLQGLEVVEEASGFPQRSGKVVLLIALTMLARHYGLVSDAESLAPLRRRTLQWGAQDYRPTLRGPEQNGPETTAT